MMDAVRRGLFLLAGLAVLAGLGWSVWAAERLLSSGAVVLLELAPVDPRSLMQGDYMSLSWALERQKIALPETSGTIVLALDARRVGTFRRLSDAGAPGAGEIAFQVHRNASGGGVMVEPHSFLFQEGHGDLYARARYGIFRVAPDGRHLLSGLADAEARPMEAR